MAGPPNAETFLGPCFAILCITFILYGLFCAQIYYYYTTYHDRLALRLAVLLLCILETVHVAASIHMLYMYLVVDYANPSSLTNILWSFTLLVYLEHTIDPLVQSYYIYRAWCVSRNKALLLALISLQLTRVALGFRATAFVCIFDTWAALGAQKSFDVYLNVTLSFDVFVDFSITAALVYYFTAKRRFSTHARSTKKILLKLAYYAITAGALTVLANIIALISYNKDKTSLNYFAILQLALKLNANSMLAMLNARKGIVSSAVGPDGVSLELPPPSKESFTDQNDIRVLQETVANSDKWNAEKYTNSTQTSNLSGAAEHV